MSKKILYGAIITMCVAVTTAAGVFLFIQFRGQSQEGEEDITPYSYDENTAAPVPPSPTPTQQEDIDEESNDAYDEDTYEYDPETTVGAITLTDPRIGWHIPPTWDFDQVFPFIGGMAGVEFFEDGYWESMHILGYMNMHGEIVIPTEHRHYPEMYAYRGAPPFSEGLVAIRSEGHLAMGVFDTAGNLVIPFDSDFGWSFQEGLLAVRRGGWNSTWGETASWGFIDHAGNEVIPFEFELARDFSEGRAAVLRDNSWGFIDHTGEVVIPFIFSRAGDDGHGFDIYPGFQEGLSRVSTGGSEENEHGDWTDTTRWGFVDRYGNLVIPHIYTQAEHFADGLATVMIGSHDQRDAYGNWYSDARWGAINRAGDTVIPFEFEWINNFNDGLATARFIDCIYVVVINNRGEIVVDRGHFRNIQSFREGRAIANNSGWENDTWVVGDMGFIDTEGNVAIPMIFSDVRNFSQGFAAVSTGRWEGGVDNSRWGIIDLDGNIVVPIEFEDIRSFSEGFAWVRHNGLWGILRINEE